MPIVLTAAAGACSARTPHPEALAVYQGAYRFTGVIDGQPVNGQLSFDGGAYFLDTDLGSCTGLLDQRMNRPVFERTTFSCRDFAIEFQVEDGGFGERAQARVSRVEQVGTRERCVNYSYDPKTRRQVCDSTVEEPVERSVVRSGVFEVTRIS